MRVWRTVGSAIALLSSRAFVPTSVADFCCCSVDSRSASNAVILCRGNLRSSKRSSGAYMRMRDENVALVACCMGRGEFTWHGLALKKFSVVPDERLVRVTSANLQLSFATYGNWFC